ncbi:carbohydrate ABC transporter permease [Paenibacillus humicola]|uniref:carbohydrate ABC transporter permease n=1 Tax=Paenibacillus humicola TaxID=3110540 RepID=UPI00237BF2DB|nr:carbohydrate ABC transporter permease [Paenibacillus humicola]
MAGKISLSRRETLSVPGKVLVYVLLGIFTIFFLFPLAWMLTTSLKVLGDVYLMPPKWIPWPMLWKNYVQIFIDQPMLAYLWNSLGYTVYCVVGTAISSSLVAYGFARLRARGRNALFLLVLATMMIPSQVTMIPQFLLFSGAGWMDTYLPLVIPAFAGSAFNIFLLRQFYLGLPRALDEATMIDGGGYFTIFRLIILPLSLPSMATVGILEFMYRWNDLMGPLVYLNTTSKYPLALGLTNFSAAYGATPWNLLMAASIVSVVPLLLIFFLAQKHFIQGIVINASK